MATAVNDLDNYLGAVSAIQLSFGSTFLVFLLCLLSSLIGRVGFLPTAAEAFYYFQKRKQQWENLGTD